MRSALGSILGLAFASLLARGAAAGGVSTLHVDQLAVSGGRHQTVWVSVLDAGGLPVPGLRSSDFAVSEDGREAATPDLTTFAVRYPRTTWTVLVDPDLFAPGPAGAGPLLAAMGRNAGSRDRLRVVSLGRDERVLEVTAPDAAGLGPALGAAGRDVSPAPIYDALYREARRAARAGADEGRCVWLVTRGADMGGARGPVEVLAAARARGRRVPVSVLLIESRTRSGEIDRLAALAERTGGTLVRAASAADLAPAAERLVLRVRGAYRLGFDAPLPAGGAGGHRLVVEARGWGNRVAGDLTFDESDVADPAWWRAPGAWLAPVALVALAALALLALRPRRICRLVVQNGEEKGCAYEIFALPVTLGAAANNDVTFPDARVSRSHAQLESRARRVEIVDLNSENGTFVNGTRITRRPLERGDRVSLGGAVELRYQ